MTPTPPPHDRFASCSALTHLVGSERALSQPHAPRPCREHTRQQQDAVAVRRDVDAHHGLHVALRVLVPPVAVVEGAILGRERVCAARVVARDGHRADHLGEVVAGLK